MINIISENHEGPINILVISSDSSNNIQLCQSIYKNNKEEALLGQPISEK